MLKSVKSFSLRIFFCIFALLKNDKRFNNNAEKLNRQGRREVAIIRETEIVGSNPTAAAHLTYTKGRRKSGQMGSMVNRLILRNLRRFESCSINKLFMLNIYKLIRCFSFLVNVLPVRVARFFYTLTPHASFQVRLPVAWLSHT